MKEGVCVSGYLRSEIGLGQAGRNLISALDAAGVPVSCHAYILPGRDHEHEFSSRYSPENDRKVNLIVLPPAEIVAKIPDLKPECYNIYYPYWELSKLCAAWFQAAQNFNEIWAPSRFIQEIYEQTNIKTTLVRQPVRIPVLSEHVDHQLCILTYFDYDSSAVRKNVKAPIHAFRDAFPVNSDVELVVKTRGATDKGIRVWLAEQAAKDERIKIIDETLTRDQMDELMMGCDVFISLHRSEGFGFGAAEALAAGKAVVSTDYSGTTDFITEETGYPVEHDLIPVREGEYPEWQNQVWAEPRIQSAVSALQRIHTDRATAREKGQKGREMMIKLYSPAAVGAHIKELLIERGVL